MGGMVRGSDSGDGSCPFSSVCKSAIVIIGGYRASALNRRQLMKNSSRDTR